MTSERHTRQKDGLGRKLTKRPKAAPRSASMEIPDRFRDGDDANEDVCAPKDKSAQYMGQSVFAMMAAAGSTTDFRSRFDDGSSSGSDNEGDDEKEQEEGKNGDDGDEQKARKQLGRGGRKKSAAEKAGADDDKSEDADQDKKRQRRKPQRKKLSERKLLKSLPRLRTSSWRGRARAQENEGAASSAIPKDSRSSSSDGDEEEGEGGLRNDAPMLSRVLQAQATLGASRSPSSGPEAADDSKSIARSIKPASLAQRLKDIFDFDDLEDVISGQFTCLAPTFFPP